MVQRRVSHEKVLSKEALDFTEIIEFLKAARLVKMVTDIGPCHEKLVKEFIMNLSLDCNIEGSQDYRKVYILTRLPRK